MSMVAIEVRRITEKKGRAGKILRSIIETIAEEKSVYVLWDMPITFEVTHAEHGRGTLMFSASYQGHAMTIFQVLDASDVDVDKPN